jgi:hypothetical protein
MVPVALIGAPASGQATISEVAVSVPAEPA